jgi:DNA mismatch repair protein MutL
LADIIQLLPDNIANQIAAGEVIQRPASAVKELLENAVDANATDIKLFVQDAGKALIQVTDNGKGMSETDARMCFERHATSKIKNINDLFSITTMGFRGEALASIAAVAQVALKTKRATDELGTYLEVENSIVTKQEPCAHPEGTSFAMKNLFFNVPARRNFLKSNTAELKHIIDEFVRVAMAFPEVAFSLTNNNQPVYALERGSLKQRLIQILGNSYNAKLVSVQQQTDYLNIYGFVGKPETAKKTRGDQYFFVNNRFIKSAYLNHAVNTAFADLLPKDSYPMYCLFIDLDPAQIDVNVHPTKQEIKFEDDKIVYAFVNSAIKHALAQFSVAPSLDFELDPTIQNLDAVSKPFTNTPNQQARNTILYADFATNGKANFITPTQHNATSKNEYTSFKSILNNPNSYVQPQQNNNPVQSQIAANTAPPAFTVVGQLHNSYIIVSHSQGYWLVQQQNAHERVLYEKFAQAFTHKPMASQQSLFPATLNFSPQDAVLITELLPDLNQLGFIIEHFGNHTFIIKGTPADVLQGNEMQAIENLLEQYKHFSMELKYTQREKLMRTLALQQAIKSNTPLTQPEMQQLIQNLFNCQTPNATPNGKPTYAAYNLQQLSSLFGR